MGLQKAGLCYAEIMNNGIFTTIEYSFLDEPFLCLYEIFLSIKDLEISAHSVYCKSFIYVHKNLFAPQTSDLLKKIGVGSFSILGGGGGGKPSAANFNTWGGGVLQKVHIRMRAHVCTHMC